MHAAMEQVTAPMDASFTGLDVDVAADRAPADAAMDRFADGDAAAFDLVYQTLSPRLYRFILRRASAAEAQDVLQQTFLRMLEARDTFVRGARVLPWAYTIALRIFVDRVRRDAREVLGLEETFSFDVPSEDLPPDELYVVREREALARERLKTLPPKLRESFELVKIEGLSNAQAGEILGITADNVKVRVHRARELLKLES